MAERRAIGKIDLIKHQGGMPLTQRHAILAKCYDCMGGYADGTRDCKMPKCSLHPWRPYRDDLEHPEATQEAQGEKTDEVTTHDIQGP